MAAVAPAHGQNAVRKEKVSVLKEVIWPQSRRPTARTPSGRGGLALTEPDGICSGYLPRTLRSQRSKRLSLMDSS